MKMMLLAVALLGLGYGFVQFTEVRDRESKQAAIAYERCVITEYGMTPTQWYETNKEYPHCGN